MNLFLSNIAVNFFSICSYYLIYKYILEREENGICGDSNSSSTESNASNWIQIYPPTLTTKLVYCLKYLVPTGEYQEVNTIYYIIMFIKKKHFLIICF